MVYLVGAGPGDPGLITAKGLDCLRRAALVICDYLVNPILLQSANATAEVVRLGHHDGDDLSPDEIHARLIAAARQGRVAVHLKGGDPDVFGRCAEETAALQAAGVSYEVVPGVTAALAAAAYAGIPLTHGAAASAVAFITGHQRRDHRPPLDYAQLGNFPGTLVFYMGMSSAADWAGALVAHGRPPQTLVAVVRRCSWPDQQVTRCTLATLAATIAKDNLRPPAVIVVGEVVAAMPAVAWFAARPLFGQRVMVTRPRGESAALCARLMELGAEVLDQPAIEIGPPADWRPVDAALTQLDRYDWLVFSSANGVSYFLDRLFAGGGDARRLGGMKLAAIGPGTAEALAPYGLRADLVPDEFRAEALAEALVAVCQGGGAAGAAPVRFLLVRASRGREVLAERLSAAGASVTQVVAYESCDVAAADPAIAAALAAGQVDWITVTSSAIARSLVRLFGEDLRRARLASISPLTSGVLAELGFPSAAEAARYTIEGVVAAIAAGSAE